MSLSKTLYPLLRTGSTQENLSQHHRKNVGWDIKNQNKQPKSRINMQSKRLYHDFINREMVK